MSTINTTSLEPQFSDEWAGPGSSGSENSPNYERLNRERVSSTSMKSLSRDSLNDSAECSPNCGPDSGEKSSACLRSSVSSGLTNPSWFRMAAQCYRVENLRDSSQPTVLEAGQSLNEWSHNDLSGNSHAMSRDWALDVHNDSAGPASSHLVTEIKFDSCAGIPTTETDKHANRELLSHGGSYEATCLSKCSEHTHVNLHHTLREAIASPLDPSEPGSCRNREEVVFTGRGPGSAPLISNRLTVNPSRGPSVTVKIQMPLDDRSFSADTANPGLPTRSHPQQPHYNHHQQQQNLTEDLDNKHVHVKKPLNAFMLFMKEKRAQVMAECTLKESAAINQILGRKWHALSREEQAKYYGLARVEKERHQRMYPGWSARDNYACQVKRRKKRAGRESLRYSSKPSRVTPQTQAGFSKQALISASSVDKAANLTVSAGANDFMQTSNRFNSRLPRYTTGIIHDSVYSSRSHSAFSNESSWAIDPFKHVTHNPTDYGAHSTDLCTRPGLMHHASMSGNITQSGRDLPNASHSSGPGSFTCLGCPEIISSFDDHVQRTINRSQCGPPFSDFFKTNEEGTVTSLKLALQQDDGQPPHFRSIVRGSREDPLTRFNIPFQARESPMYPPDQWQSESLNLDIACARFGLAPGDRFGKAPCAPVPDLLQSTQGSDMIARFSRPSSLSGQSLTDSLTSPPTTVTQSHTGIFGHSQTATNLAMAAADTAFTLRASSLEQSESTSVACYEARAYSPVLYPSLQQTIREINCTDLSPNPSADHDFVLFDKREQFVHPTKTPEEFSSESKSTVNEKTSE